MRKIFLFLLFILTYQLIFAQFEIVWKKKLSGELTSITQTFDGGFAITGKKNNNILITKVDKNGNEKWTKTFNNSENNKANSIKKHLMEDLLLQAQRKKILEKRIF